MDFFTVCIAITCMIALVCIALLRSELNRINNRLSHMASIVNAYAEQTDRVLNLTQDVFYGKMIFEQSGPSFGDATAPYNVILKDENVLVGNFIQEVLEQRPDDWGYIHIRKERVIAYKKGKIIYQSSLLDMFHHLRIKNVKAYGDWSRMDYYIEVED